MSAHALIPRKQPGWLLTAQIVVLFCRNCRVTALGSGAVGWAAPCGGADSAPCAAGYPGTLFKAAAIGADGCSDILPPRGTLIGLDAAVMLLLLCCSCFKLWKCGNPR